MKYTIKKLSNSKYEVKETLTGQKKLSHVDKEALTNSINGLKDEIIKKQALLVYKEELLTEINKIT